MSIFFKAALGTVFLETALVSHSRLAELGTQKVPSVPSPQWSAPHSRPLLLHHKEGWTWGLEERSPGILRKHAPTPTPLPEQAARYDRWSLEGLWARHILNITPGQGRLKLADTGTSPRAERQG